MSCAVAYLYAYFYLYLCLYIYLYWDFIWNFPTQTCLGVLSPVSQMKLMCASRPACRHWPCAYGPGQATAHSNEGPSWAASGSLRGMSHLGQHLGACGAWAILGTILEDIWVPPMGRGTSNYRGP